MQLHGGIVKEKCPLLRMTFLFRFFLVSFMLILSCLIVEGSNKMHLGKIINIV